MEYSSGGAGADPWVLGDQYSSKYWREKQPEEEHRRPESKTGSGTANMKLNGFSFVRVLTAVVLVADECKSIKIKINVVSVRLVSQHVGISSPRQNNAQMLLNRGGLSI